jgi:hypothetical protein
VQRIREWNYEGIYLTHLCNDCLSIGSPQKLCLLFVDSFETYSLVALSAILAEGEKKMLQDFPVVEKRRLIQAKSENNIFFHNEGLINVLEQLFYN